MTMTSSRTPLITTNNADFSVFLAQDGDDVLRAQRLRYEVFNLELGEGLASSHESKIDADAHDLWFDHIVIEHIPTCKVVGTYRLWTGSAAKRSMGYYSEQEFDLGRFHSISGELIELGRACVHKDYRDMFVLGLLWKAIARYARIHRARYLIGCSSLTSQDEADGAAAYELLAKGYLAPRQFQTSPHPEYRCNMDAPNLVPPKMPRLLLGYLRLGAKICGPPAIDREFGTIDFLTFLDLHTIPEAARKRFLGD